jgi:hypothetical protein
MKILIGNRTVKWDKSGGKDAGGNVELEAGVGSNRN